MAPDPFIDAWTRIGIQLRHVGMMQASDEHRRLSGSNFWCLLVVRHGAMRLGTAAEEVRLEAPAACLASPAMTWRRLPDQAGTVSMQCWFQLFAPPGYPNPLLKLPLPKSVTPRDPDHFEERLDRILTAFDDWRPIDAASACHASYEFGSLLLEHFTDGFAAGEFDDQTFAAGAPDWLRHAFEPIVATAKEHGWTVSGLAASVGVSRLQLERACKRYYGTTPSRLMRQHRIRFAVQQLRNGHWTSVEHAAMKMGYPHARLFWRHCVAETGKPPSHWLNEGR